MAQRPLSDSRSGESPLLNVRLPAELRDRLDHAVEVTGAGGRSAFVRELIVAGLEAREL